MTRQRDLVDETIQFSVLGPVRAWRAGKELRLGPKQQRLILGVLLARAGRPVPLGEFVELLWDGFPPASAANAVHRYVGVLRRLLEPGLPARSPGRWLVRQAGGYLLRVDEDCLDLLNFRTLVEQARHAVGSGDWARAVGLFTTALGLWQGRCAADLKPFVGTHPAFVMIEHEYVSVVCEAAAASLRCDRAGAVLLPLRHAVERNPLDEALLSHLLLVLAADGKQAEAMALYQETRLRLADELGVDPGTELSAAYDRVLRQETGGTAGTGENTGTAATAENPPADPADDHGAPAPAGVTVPREAPPVKPVQLPSDLPCFVGREDALAHATALTRATGGSAPRVLAIDGIPGIGKTALAVRLAHRVAGDFPDGQLYADLRGFVAEGSPRDPHEVLQGFLSALGVGQQNIPAQVDARAALYRSVLAGLRVLVVLDNARDIEQVRPLLPGTSECRVIVTSRSRLTGLAAGHGAHLLTLDVPTRQEATAGFLERIRASRPGEDIDMDLVERIVEGCGRLPLAVAIVAARAASHPGHPLPQVAAELVNSRITLDGFSDDNLDNDVRSVFSWSYRTLSDQAARLFRLLPLHPGPDLTVAAMASLAGVAPRAASAAVGELVRTRLLTVQRRDRYWSHDLVLAYAAELDGETRSERAAALARLHDHYRQTAHAAHLMLRPPTRPVAPPPPLPGVTPETMADSAAAMDWFTNEHSVLRAVVENTATRGESRATWELALKMQLYQQRHGCWHDWAATMRLALETARRAEDTEGMARTQHGLAGAHHFLGDCEESLRYLKSAQENFEELGLVDDLAHVLKNLGSVRFALGDYAVAVQHQEQAMRLLRATGQRALEATTTLLAGYSRLELGDVTETALLADTAATIFREVNDLNGVGSCMTLLGRLHHIQRDHSRSIAFYEQGIDLMRRAGSRANVMEALVALGDIHFDAGDVSGARRAWTDAVNCVDDPVLPLVTQAKARLRASAL
ncbi:BTAD domain-containing putative transcriptional regulator [Streptomyces sp. NPDC014676]|uniref:AfsR/SARP family transcriptional regulator n=1 Tax=Streptomyces sp. NPDC014676 TaxID=3364879 RepID=UPI0036FB7F86